MSPAKFPGERDGYDAKIARCIAEVIAAIEADASFRVPHTEAERQNAFADWLAAYRSKLAPVIQAALQSELPSPFERQNSGVFQDTIENRIWPEVAQRLRSYAVRYQAGAWVRQHLGDAVTLGIPKIRGERWYVPLGVASNSAHLGQVVLDANGMVLSDLTSTCEQIREKLHGRKLSSITTAAEQQ
ncbi:MAG TPA: hypothetical protein VFB38_23515 [Chthonomonadaceae bacterium]|nr:hypothetical protein [Chthonomonadaceae bacterium]